MTDPKPTFWFKVSNALILLSLLLTLILPWWTGEKDFNIGGYFLVKRTDAVFPWGVFVTIDHFQAYQILFFYKGNNFGSSDDPLAEALLSPYNASGRAFWLFVVFTMVLLSIILLVLGNYKKSPFHLGIATFLLFLASMTFLFAWVGTTGFFSIGFYFSFASFLLGLIHTRTLMETERARAQELARKKAEELDARARMFLSKVNENQQETRRLRIVRDRYSLSILMGSILVVLGFSIWWYVQSVVSGLDQLVNASTTQEEMWRYSGSLQWWRHQQTSLLNPLATILISIGIFLIGNAVFWLARRAIITRSKEGS